METVTALDGQRYETILRPSARPFLEALQLLGDVSVLTSGRTSFQTIVLCKHGIDHLTGEIYGFDRGLLIPERWLLVDDLKINAVDLKLTDEGIIHKVKRLGVEISPDYRSANADVCAAAIADFASRVIPHLVSCKPFYGFEDKEPLTNLIAEIEEKLKALK